jgi:Flp pilus assembly protein TadG
MEYLGIAWAISGILILALTIYSLRYIQWRRLLKLRREENGAAYALSFVMIFPLYLTLVAVFLETTLMFQAKLGTMFAAYSAARSASVHTTVAFPDDRNDDFITENAITYGTRSAVYAMTPFACGMKETPSNSQNCTNFWNAYDDYLEGKKKPAIAEKYRVKKYSYAEKAMKVNFELGEGEESEPWKQDIIVTIEYEAPFFLPYIGKLLGGKPGQFSKVVSKITSTESIQNECPQNETGSLGIEYP